MNSGGEKINLKEKITSTDSISDIKINVEIEAPDQWTCPECQKANQIDVDICQKCYYFRTPPSTPGSSRADVRNCTCGAWSRRRSCIDIANCPAVSTILQIRELRQLPTRRIRIRLTEMQYNQLQKRLTAVSSDYGLASLSSSPSSSSSSSSIQVELDKHGSTPILNISVCQNFVGHNTSTSTVSPTLTNPSSTSSMQMSQGDGTGYHIWGSSILMLDFLMALSRLPDAIHSKGTKNNVLQGEMGNDVPHGIFYGRTIVELGAGTGLCSLASFLQEAKLTIATDMNTEMAERNLLPKYAPSVQVVPHTWGRLEELERIIKVINSSNNGGSSSWENNRVDSNHKDENILDTKSDQKEIIHHTCDVILLSDVLYFSTHLDDLCESLFRLTNSSMSSVPTPSPHPSDKATSLEKRTRIHPQTPVILLSHKQRLEQTDAVFFDQMTTAGFTFFRVKGLKKEDGKSLGVQLCPSRQDHLDAVDPTLSILVSIPPPPQESIPCDEESFFQAHWLLSLLAPFVEPI